MRLLLGNRPDGRSIANLESEVHRRIGEDRAIGDTSYCLVAEAMVVLGIEGMNSSKEEDQQR